MSGLVGDKVFVLKLSTKSDPDNTITSPAQSPRTGMGIFVGSIEDVIDSWGPGLLLSEPGASYGERVHSVLIGSGSILRSDSRTEDSSKDTLLYYWSRDQQPSSNLGTFNIRDSLRIGAITIQLSCPLDSEKYRKASESYLDKISTEMDYWRLAE